MNYEREREKLYEVLYGRKPDFEEESEELELNNSSYSGNATGAAISGISAMMYMMLPWIIFFMLLAWAWTAPGRFIDWFGRGGVEIKKFRYPEGEP